jgi:hypothetical protein
VKFVAELLAPLLFLGGVARSDGVVLFFNTPSPCGYSPSSEGESVYGFETFCPLNLLNNNINDTRFHKIFVYFIH